MACQRTLTQPTVPHDSSNRAYFELSISYTRLIIYLCILFPYELFADVMKSVAVHGAHVPVKLATQAGRQYDARAIEQDVRALWSTGRFEDIRVDSNADGDGVSVVF